MEVNRVNTVPLAAVQAVQAETPQQASPELAQAVSAVNGAKLFGEDSELTFAMDRESRRVVVRLVDRKSRQVIRQIPPQYLLAIAEDLRKGSP